MGCLGSLRDRLDPCLGNWYSSRITISYSIISLLFPHIKPHCICIPVSSPFRPPAKVDTSPLAISLLCIKPSLFYVLFGRSPLRSTPAQVSITRFKPVTG